MHALSKIIARHAGKEAVEVSEIVNVVPDYVMLNDRGAARAADLFRQMGGEQVFDPDKVVVVFDHHYPPIRQQDSVSQKQTRAWAKEQASPSSTLGKELVMSSFRKKVTPFRAR